MQSIAHNNVHQYHQPPEQQVHEQRQPMRINLHHNQPDEAARTSGEPDNGKQLAKASTTSRLKSSTISRVPSAKSRLHQPVASLTSATPAIVTPAISSRQPNAQLQIRPNPAKPAGDAAGLARARPTSLALKTPATTKLSVAPKLYTSILPKLTGRVESLSKKQAPQQQPQIRSQQASKVGSSKPNLPVPTSSSNNNNKPQSQAADKRKCAIGQSTTSGLESRLSGLTRNLVAVVRPQGSLCVNANTPLKRTVPANSVNSKIAAAGTSTTKAIVPRGEFESRKDLNGLRAPKEKRGNESKQDAERIAVHHTSGEEARSISNSLLNAEALNSNSAGGPTSKASSKLKCSSTTANGHKDDHFKRSDNPKLANVSVGNNNSDYTPEKTQTQFHGNIKQPSSALSLSSSSSSLANRHLFGSTNLSTSFMKLQAIETDEQLTNNCYNNHADVGAELNQTPVNRSPVILFEEQNNNTSRAHAINDHILAKPMGQQVLSLMMLDVGLMPANNCYQQQEQSSQQQISNLKRSYVRVQSPDASNNSGQVGGDNSCFIDSGSSCFAHDDRTTNAANKLNCFVSRSLESRNHGQSGDYFPLQPVHQTRETLSLQVQIDRNNDNFKSISLPTSPRLKNRGRTNKRGDDRRLGRQGVVGEHHLCDPGHGNGSSGHLSSRTQDLQKAIEALAISCSNKQSRIKNDRLLQACDNLDSHSIASSSCSSLNQCPPLLALSNQLNGTQFEELVKANVEQAAKNKRCNQIVPEPVLLEQQLQRTTNSYFGASRATQQHQQHQVITNHLNVRVEVPLSKKIDHVDVGYSELDFRSATTSVGARVGCDASGKTANEEAQVQPNHLLPGSIKRSSETPLSEMEQIDRRQTQYRSNSISGQEFHANGGYQRLKYSLYSQTGVLDDQVNSLANRSQRIPSPFQQQQPQRHSGRSPSPININSQNSYVTSRDGTLKYQCSERQPRNQLHASLECLNTTYSDYQNPTYQAHKPQHHLQHQQQQFQNQNQHYAASYVLAPTPANTVVNQNGDQDFAAAAMGGPTQYQSTRQAINTNGYGNQTQSLLNRALAQVTQSPFRRMTSSNIMCNTTSQNPLGQMSNAHHSMRAGHSSLSLASSSYILEDKLQNEIRKLQSELKSEKEKNEALNSQLNINSSLMSAFEQSLTTLNSRLRQLTSLNERKDNEIHELKEQLQSNRLNSERDDSPFKSPTDETVNEDSEVSRSSNICEKDMSGEQDHIKVIEDLKRQLIEKDRLLTDTRLEALSAAHQLEQLESKLNGEHSLLINEDDLDEGVMVINNSPSESDATTDSAHFSEINSQITKTSQFSKVETMHRQEDSNS